MDNIILNQEIKKYNIVLNQTARTYNITTTKAVRNYNIVNNKTVRKYNVYTIQNLTKYSIINNNLYRGGVFSDLTQANQYSRWHPDGVIFKYNILEAEDGSKKETISYSSGNIFIHQWKKNETLKNVSYNNIEVTEEEVETPVFVLGESTERIKKVQYKQYYITCRYYTSIKFYLDEASVIGGNNININTGEVLWDANWEGESTITVVAEGIGGSKEATHVVTTTEYDEENPIFDKEDNLNDLTPIYRKVKVLANEVELNNTGVYYLMLKYPLDELEEYASLIVSDTYLRENLFDGYTNILMGVLNGVEDNRTLAMEWGNSGKNEPKVIPPVVIQTRWKDVSKSCLLDGNGKNTGQQEIHQKKQKLVNGLWVDMLEETTIVITNTTDCPIPFVPYFISYMVGLEWDQQVESKRDYVLGTTLKLKTQSKSGYNYLFISIPTGKTYSIADGTGIPIEDMFTLIKSDNRTGYQPNSIYRKNPKYGTINGLTFTIKVE